MGAPAEISYNELDFWKIGFEAGPLATSTVRSLKSLATFAVRRLTASICCLVFLPNLCRPHFGPYLLSITKLFYIKKSSFSGTCDRFTSSTYQPQEGDVEYSWILGFSLSALLVAFLTFDIQLLLALGLFSCRIWLATVYFQLEATFRGVQMETFCHLNLTPSLLLERAMTVVYVFTDLCSYLNTEEAINCTTRFFWIS